ncbi:MAG: acyltransferase [Bacteroidaceae bacterium]|nr:acyltransferase [Bacteroidaceae bacterium]
MMTDEKQNIGWIDMLRVVACFFVVFSHCCDPFVAQFDANREMFLTGVFAGSLMRPCVPLFAMMTAVLLLPIKPGTTVNRFYRKRIGRIIVPLAFWSVALPLMAFLYFTVANPETANMQLSVNDYTTDTLLQRLYTFIFNFNFDTTPLWYLYMLIGLYLIMPMISSWLTQATRKEIKTVLCIWGATLLLPYLKMVAPLLGYKGNYGHMGLYGECDWNVYGTFYYVSGFAGYLILAYYLKKFPLEWSWRKIAAICIPMFIAGYAITSVGYIVTNEHFPGNYAYLEIVWYFTGINVFMMTFPLFVTIQKVDTKPRKWLSQMARLTFGVYLCHFTFTFLSYDLYDTPALPYLVRIMLAALTTGAISVLLTWIMSKFRFTRIFVS